MGQRATAVGIGVATGLFAGLLGVGGGLIMVPGMTALLHLRQREAHGTSLLVIIPIAMVGALILGGSHDVDLLVGVLLALASIVGAVLGARLTSRLSDRILRTLFGIAALAIGVVMLLDAGLALAHLPLALHPGTPPEGVVLVAVALVIGLLAGIVSGLLGVGGGIIMVPAMVLILGLSQHLAQGTSLLVIIPTAASGSITHFRLGNIRLGVAAWLSAGGIVGALAGASLALLVPDTGLRILFAIYLLYTGSRMIWPRASVE